MTLTVWTAPLRYRGRRRTLDITRVGADRDGGRGAAFAPSWPILRAVKDLFRLAEQHRAEGRQDEAARVEATAWADYKPQYLAEMLVSSGRADVATPPGWTSDVEAARARGVVPRPDTWTWLLAQEEVVLLCYCPRAAICHRTLLASVLGKLGAVVRGEVEPYVVIGCGSRTWYDPASIRAVLERSHPDTLLVHGAAKGADTLLDQEARALGYRRKGHPADWSLYRASGGTEGREAGPVRNAAMLATYRDVVREGVAFGALRREDGSTTGTGDMVGRLRAARVPVLWTPEPGWAAEWLDGHIPERLLSMVT